MLAIIAFTSDEISRVMVLGFVAGLAGLALIGWGLVRRDQSPAIAVTGWWPAYLALLLPVTWAIVLNLNQVAADVYHKQGDLYDRASRYMDSVAAYQRAVSLSPSQDYYALFVGRSLLELAKRAPAGVPVLSPAQYEEASNSLSRQQMARMTREDFLNVSLVALLRARALRPLNTDHYANLARLNRYWGDSGDPARLEVASRYYAQATKLSPATAHLYSEWALTELARRDVASAREKSQKSIALDPKFAPGQVIAGDVEMFAGGPKDAWKFHSAALDLNALALNDSRFEARINSYLNANMGQTLTDRYSRLAQSLPDNTQVRTVYAFLLSRTGRPAEASQQYKAIIVSDPSNWMAYRNLALNYLELADLPQAIQYMENALRLAPDDQKPQIQATVNDMRRRASPG